MERDQILILTTLQTLQEHFAPKESVHVEVRKKKDRVPQHEHIPHFRFVLEKEEDAQRMDNYSHDELLNVFHKKGYPFTEVVVCRLNKVMKVMDVYSWSAEAVDIMLQSWTSTAIAGMFDLSQHCHVKKERYWVWVHTVFFSNEDLKKAQTFVPKWNASLGLHIIEAKWDDNKLLWGFNTIPHARQAAYRMFDLSGAFGWGE